VLKGRRRGGREVVNKGMKKEDELWIKGEGEENE